MDSKRSKALALRKPIKKNAVNLKVNDIALCKMRGHPEWPCKVIGMDGKMIEVEFFGDHTRYKTIISNFFDINESFEVMLYNLRRLKSSLYKKSVKEVEISMGIPCSKSILLQIA